MEACPTGLANRVHSEKANYSVGGSIGIDPVLVPIVAASCCVRVHYRGQHNGSVRAADQFIPPTVTARQGGAKS